MAEADRASTQEQARATTLEQARPSQEATPETEMMRVQQLAGNRAASAMAAKFISKVQRDVDATAPTTTRGRFILALDSGDANQAISLAPLLRAEADGLLTDATIRAKATSCFGNDEMQRALLGLRGQLKYSLVWAFDEGTEYSKVQLLIRTCPRTIDVLGDTHLRDEMVSLCDNEEMAWVVDRIGTGAPTDFINKLNWMSAEGSDWQYMRPVIIHTPADQRAVAYAHSWALSLFTSACNNQEMAEATELLGGTLEQKLRWMIDEGTNLQQVTRAIQAVPDGLLAVQHTPAVDRMLDGEFSGADRETLRQMLQSGLMARQAGVSENRSEVLQAGATTGTFAPRTFEWHSGFDVAYYRDRLQIDLRIALEAVNAQAATQLAPLQPAWQSAINSAWDNHFKMVNGTDELPVRINVQFTGSNPHHTVRIHAGPPTWPNYNMTNWFTGQAGNHGPIHEVGHMLGNPDEYMASAAHYQERTGHDPTTDPNAVPSTDTAGNVRYSESASIMGTGNDIQLRHLRWFERWLNEHRTRAQSGATSEAAYRLQPI
jgi:hypothetical protein